MAQAEVSAPKVDKDEWIRSLVNGQTFADVGGLWRAMNEKISVALKAGATAATMIDVEPLDSKLWEDFRARCALMNVSGYDCVQADATVPDLRERVGAFDVVHCAGVIYHVPDLDRVRVALADHRFGCIVVDLFATDIKLFQNHDADSPPGLGKLISGIREGQIYGIPEEIRTPDSQLRSWRAVPPCFRPKA